MKIQFILIILFLPFFGISQKVLLEENVEYDTLVTKFGQNYANYRHFYISAGFLTGENNPGSEIIFVNSRQMELGYRYKRKISDNYAFGLGLSICNSSFYLNQKANKIVPNDSLHSSEKIAINSLKLELYNRINIGKRGNIIGKFMDIGFFTSYNYRAKHITKDKLTDTNKFFAKKVKSVYKGLEYIENFGYGLGVRLGINRYVIYSQLRLTNIFKSNYNMPELPVYSVGIQIGLH